MKRTTKKQFGAFKAEFIRWQKRLGLLEWKVYFFHLPRRDAFACVNTDVSGCCVSVTMTTEIDGDVADKFDPRECARHEAFELLLAPLHKMACAQCAPRRVVIETHRVIRRLENLADA